MANEDVLFERLGKVFPPGTVIFRDGETGREMYVIQSGKIKIFKRIRDVEKTLAILPEGEFFGEMSILNNNPRSASAEVVEEAKLLVIDPKTFEQMIKGNPEIALRIIKKLAQRLQEADDQIENLLIKDSASKIVHTLGRLADTTGKAVDGGIKVAINAGGLAQKTGLEESAIKETVDKLVKAKLVTTEADGLVIGDVDKLRKYLEFLAMKEQFGDAD